MEKKIQIICDWNNNVLFEGKYESIRQAVINAVSEDAYLRGANLRYAYLRGANLRDAYLEDANLRDTDLGGACLESANLRDAYLEGAYLRVADLRGADLRDADLRDAYLRYAKINDTKTYIEPIQILGLEYFVLIYADRITIGCEDKSIKEWTTLPDNATIEQVDGISAEYWKLILSMARKHSKHHRVAKKKEEKPNDT